MVIRTILILVLVFHLLPTEVLPQADLLPYKRYGVKEGLPSYNIYKTIQDRWGFLWLTSQDGLFRFDGKIFRQVYLHDSAGHYISNDIEDITIDQEGFLWAGLSYGGLFKINTLTCKIVDRVDRFAGLKEEYVRSIYCDSNRLFIGTINGLFVYDTRLRKVKALNIPSAIKKSAVSDIVLSGSRLYIAIDDYGAVILDKNSFQCTNMFPLDEEFRLTNQLVKITGLVVHSELLIISTPAGIQICKAGDQYDPAVFSAFQYLRSHLKGSSILDINIRQQDVWISTGQGLFLYSLQEGASSLKLLFKDDYTYSSFIDKDENIWLCGVKYFYRISLPSGEVFKIYHRGSDGKYALNHVYTLCSTGDLVYATSLYGLFKVRLPDHFIEKLDKGSASTTFHSAYSLNSQNIMVSSEEGVFVLRNDKIYPIEKFYSEWTAFRKLTVSSVEKLSDTTLVLGTEYNEGLLIWNLKQKKIVQLKKPALPTDIVNDVCLLGDKMIGIASDSLVYSLHLETGQVRSISDGFSTQRSKPIFLDLFYDSVNLWVSTYGRGLIQYNMQTGKDSVIDTKNGLSNNNVYMMVKDAYGYLWVSTNIGLNRIDPEKGAIQNYFQDDGLHGDSFDEKGVATNKNEIFFGGPGGFTRIRTDKIANEKRESHLLLVRAGYTDSEGESELIVDAANEYRFPENTSLVSFDIAYLALFQSEKNKIVYTINDTTGQYISNGTSSTIRLAGLNYGDYTLYVKAIDAAGKIPNKWLTVRFTIPPRWYQTTWLKILVILAVVALAYAFYRMRINEIRKEGQLRKKFAGDLHDDLGSTLNSIKIYLNLALMKKENAPYLNQVKDGVQNAIVSVRDMVWILDDKQDSVRHLVERIDQFADPLATANNARFEKSVHHSVQEQILSKKEKRNLFLIIKEAVNNSIKYASANVISLNIGLNQKSKLFVEITDDGKGFDVNQEKKGYGLENISLRAGQIRYQLQIDTSNGNGTRIRLVKI